MSMRRILSAWSQPGQTNQELVTEELCSTLSRANYHGRLELVLPTQHIREAALCGEAGPELAAHQVGGSLPGQEGVGSPEK